MYNYFCEIFKFRDFINTLRNFAKPVLLIFSQNLTFDIYILSPELFIVKGQFAISLL